MNEEIFIPLAFFAMIAAIVLVPGYLRMREKERLHETLRLAYEKGQPVPPEMIEALQTEKSHPAPDRDLRRGIILLSIAAAIIFLGVMLGMHEHAHHAQWPLVGMAAFPGFIGIGYLVFWGLSRRKSAA